MNNPDNYPIDAFPPLIKNTAYEMHDNTKISIPLICQGMMSAISLSSQQAIDVQLPYGNSEPVSLYFITIADSGEGKTVVEDYTMLPVREFQKEQDDNHKIVLDKLKCSSKVDEEVTSQILSSKWKLITNDTTLAKLLLNFNETWPTTCLCSDEAGILLSRQTSADQGIYNQIWGGKTISIDRKSSPSFKVENTRLTISLMIQPKSMWKFLNKKGDIARDNGFIPRFLIACPISTKGYRFLPYTQQTWNYLPKFQQRVMDLLEQSKAILIKNGSFDRNLLKMSDEARITWIDFRNHIEGCLAPGGYYSDVSDAATKITNNAARMAALFHYYEGLEGYISSDTMNRAITICTWYLNEFKRLFLPPPVTPPDVQDAFDLEQWLIQYCYDHPGHIAVQKSHIMQYGPNRLRKKGRLQMVLGSLSYQNKIRIMKIKKKNWIYLNPDCFPIPRANESLDIFMYQPVPVGMN